MEISKIVYYDENIVDVSKIKEDLTEIMRKEKLSVRTMLDIPLLNKKADSITVLVIMMNPSKASSTRSDDTVNKVVKFLNTQTNVGIITICNLFPFYESNSKNVENIFKINQSYADFQQSLVDNRKTIKSKILTTNKVILAYGDCPATTLNDEHKNEADFVLDQLRGMSNVFVFSYSKRNTLLSKKKNPYHPARSGSICCTKNIEIKLNIALK